MRVLFLIPVKLYQWLISPLLGNNCRHIPSCSEYTFEAIQEHGAIKGIGLGVKRICKCHPWAEAKFDPVPKKLSH
jgi:putative membrane protein insertion efficiency factor